MKRLYKRCFLLLVLIILPVAASAHSPADSLQTPPIEPLPPYNSQYLHSYIHERGSIEQGSIEQGSYGEPGSAEAKPLPNVTDPAFIVQLGSKTM